MFRYWISIIINERLSLPDDLDALYCGIIDDTIEIDHDLSRAVGGGGKLPHDRLIACTDCRSTCSYCETGSA
jgi:hypothetical protein